MTRGRCGRTPVRIAERPVAAASAAVVARRAAFVVVVAITFSPLVSFMMRALRFPGGADAVLRFAVSSGLWRTIGVTTTQALLSAFFSVVAALPGAYAVGRLVFPGRRIIRSFSLVPFVLPSIVVVVGMIGFYGRSGMLRAITGVRIVPLYGLVGIVVAHVYFNVSIGIRLVGDAWYRIGDEYREVALINGAGLGQSALRVIFPLLRPALVSSFLLAFVFSFMSFGIVLVFGGVRFMTLEVRIYQELFAHADPPAASLYGIVQLLFSSAFVLVHTRLFRAVRTERDVVPGRLKKVGMLPPVVRVALIAYGAFFLLFIVGPPVSLLRSLSPSAIARLFGVGEPGRNLVEITGSSLGGIVFRSLAVALASASICFVLAFALARRRRGTAVQLAAHLPLGVSLVSYAAGLRTLAGDGAPDIPLVIVAEVFLAFPIVFRMVETVLSDLDTDYVDAARLLGAGPGVIALRVQFPLLRRGLTNAFGYGVAMGLADFTAVLTVARGRVVTFPVAIYRLLGFRSFDVAIGLSCLYIVVACALFFAVDSSVSSAPDAGGRRLPPRGATARPPDRRQAPRPRMRTGSRD